MSSVSGGGRVSQLIKQHETFIDKAQSNPVSPGTGMSEASKTRMNELNKLPTHSLTKSEKNELTGLKTQYDNPGMLEKAKELQKTGGVLFGHAVALTSIADEKDICICIRAVNPKATGLVESGFGTKDMSIKAKSSNLPPLNGLIPYDQKFGKKGDDPKDVAKFNEKNHHAIEDRVATKTDAKMPFERLEYLKNETNAMSMDTLAKGLKPNEILISSTDFGKEFKFIAVRDGDDVTIFEAVQNNNGEWSHGDEAVQVMANRDGKPVTADYDLALVAPRVSDLGPQHMSSLKMASFNEVERRTNVVTRFTEKLNEITEKFKTDPTEAQKQLDDLFPTGGLNEEDKKKLESKLNEFKEGSLSPSGLRDLGRQAAQLDFTAKIVPEALKKNEERYAPKERNLDMARNAIQEAITPPVGEPMEKSDFIETFQNLTGTHLEADTKFEAILEDYPKLTPSQVDTLANILGGSLEGTSTRDLGIVSSFIKELVPELNQVVGQTDGREVFHHGDDAGNPYSVEKDNFPMTVILPKGAAHDGEQIRIIKDSSEFLTLAKDLKRQGYAVPINELWNGDSSLKDVRRESFTEARDSLAKSLGATVQDMISLASLSKPV